VATGAAQATVEAVKRATTAARIVLFMMTRLIATVAPRTNQ
jgi:hypothetical protein